MNFPLGDIVKLNAGTFQYDETLPKLTIPNLNETFNLYLKSIKAIASDDIIQVEKNIKTFIHSDESKDLQNALISRSECLDNWLSIWWMDEMYLKHRDRLIPFWNIASRSTLYNYVWPVIENGNLFDDEILRRLSRYVYSLLKFWLCLRFEMVVPNISRDNKPLSMTQMRKIFNSCRVPVKEKDRHENYFRTLSEMEIVPNHIILGCEGRIFMIKALSENNEIHSHKNLITTLEEIADFCKKNGPGPALATLTSLPRDEWAEYYDIIRNFSHENAQNIDLIQQSICWLCLNDKDPPDLEHLIEKAMKVDCQNIWADKSFYLSIYSNGLITYGSDHTPMDGVAVGLSITFAENEIICGKGKETCKLEVLETIREKDSRITWKELTFDLPSNFKVIINNAHSSYLNICNSLEAHTFLFKSFSRKISRSFKLHPDTVFQLFLQLAYIRIHGSSKPATVYETATTRQFRYGRTETIRSCTIESVAWMRALMELGPSNPKVLPLFLKAHEAHNELRNLCERGKGCDRHIFGLIMASQLTPELKSPLLENIINLPSFEASGSKSSFILSTSSMGSSECLGVVAPMTKNGYGVFYRIVEDCCEAAVSKWQSEESGKGYKLLEELDSCFLLLPLICNAKLKPQM